MTLDLVARERVLLLEEFGDLRSQASAAVDLFGEGATLPFIARYRKERTGGLTETQLKEIRDRRAFHEGLRERKSTILDSLREQNVLTPELEEAVVSCRERQALEDLYLPHRPKRRTRAQVAREKGHGPLAEKIWAHQPAAAEPEALDGACDILAERMADDPRIRKRVREVTLAKGRLRSRRKRGEKADRSKYETYFDFVESFTHLASHRALAIFRGEREGVLSASVDVDAAPILAWIDAVVNRPRSPHHELFRRIVQDAYERLLAPSIESEVRASVGERAEREAIQVFAENLRHLLLAPPVRGQAILGIDPGLRTGCKLAVIDRAGRFLESAVIFPGRPDAGPAIARLVAARQVGRIAYGNGTGSRELEDFLRRANLGVPFHSVSEAGASVYSASDAAVREFPGLDVTLRGAISIARRLQDPLAELVKIEPKAIGVGQYQHDVDAGRLQQELDHVVESCVNGVGVDVNTASVELLSYVAGITRPVAEGIVRSRPFKSREDLKSVTRLGPRMFEQAAGFLRIPDAANPLDASAVHPESYPVVARIARRVGKPVAELVGKELDVRPEEFVDDRVGLPTVVDILEELKKPGRDPRTEFTAAKFDPAITAPEHVQPGMILEGVVANVAQFGVFVDIGVHLNGLVHVSELSARFVSDPNDVARVGQVVKVKVLSVDLTLGRIALSLKQASP